MKTLKQARVWVGVAVVAVLMVGCSPNEEQQVQTERAAPPAVELPPLEVDAEAPVLVEVFPRLSSGPLAYARLVSLPDGVLLRTEQLALGQADIDAELADAPLAHREMLSKNGFMLLENLASGQLLEGEARQALTEQGRDVAAMSQQAVIQLWMSGLVSGVQVSQEEIEAFYDDNRDLVGGAPLAQIQPQLEQHLLQQKQQETVEAHIRGLGQRITLAVDADWTAMQDRVARDNPVDRARDSGRPTMASFGADTCRPCQLMKPFRAAVEQTYPGRVNVVYVHVNQDHMLASRYGVRGIPHTIFFGANGEEVESRTGFMSLEQIETVLASMGVSRE